MRILVVGSGGREHALASAAARSDAVSRVFALPGREGFRNVADVLGGGAPTIDSILAAARSVRADLTIVGPETPLVEGVADLFRSEGVPLFGPVAAAARLEGSKHFAKEVLEASGVPTARSVIVRRRGEIDDALRRIDLPAAVKADGLAAGKGVVIAREESAAREAVDRFLGDDRYDEKGVVVFEECLEGEELSLFALVSGRKYALFPTARDYKRIGDGGKGPNTGGMGAVTPVDRFGAPEAERIGETLFPPLLEELERRGILYEGILYAGIMLTAGGPMVLEFNCRFGDPEAQALLPHLAADAIPRFREVARGEWTDGPFEAAEGVSVCVVLAAHGYPGKPRTGDVIEGIDEAVGEGAVVFHAGTERAPGRWVTAGGRVLNVVAGGSNVAEARRNAYRAAGRIRFDGVRMRGDIGVAGVRG